MWSWYIGRWWVGCWYSQEGTGRAAAPPKPLLALRQLSFSTGGVCNVEAVGDDLYHVSRQWRLPETYLHTNRLLVFDVTRSDDAEAPLLERLTVLISRHPYWYSHTTRLRTAAPLCRLYLARRLLRRRRLVVCAYTPSLSKIFLSTVNKIIIIRRRRRKEEEKEEEEGGRGGGKRGGGRRRRRMKRKRRRKRSRRRTKTATTTTTTIYSESFITIPVVVSRNVAHKENHKQTNKHTDAN